jgi:hypothetical protein
MKGKEVSQSFFDAVMQKLGVTPTAEKRKFFRAWQQAEATNAIWNPLATTKKTSTSKPLPGNTAGVQQYSSESDGVAATAGTLNLDRYYKELTDKLKQDDVTAKELANSTSALKTWSGGDGKYVARRLGSYSGETSAIQNTIDADSTTVTNFNEVLNYISKNFKPAVRIDNNRIRFNYDGNRIIINRNGSATTWNPQTKTKSKEAWILTKSGDNYTLTIGNRVYQPTSSVSIESDSEEWEIIDYVQLAMDFLGFIPIIGDVIDIINALIYFYREKYVDGFLSLIAVIPVAGSFIKLGLKGAIKATGAASAANSIRKALSGNTADLTKLLQTAQSTGKLDKLQLKQIADFGDSAAKMLNSSKKTLKQYESALEIAGVPTDAVLKQFDTYVAQVKNITSAADAARDVSTASKVAGKLAKRAIKLPFKVADIALTFSTLGGWLVIKKLFKLANMNIGRMSQLVDGLRSVYKSKLLASPTLAAQMAKANNVIPPSLLTRLSGDASSIQIRSALDNLKQTNPSQYKKAIDEISRQSATSNNPYYRLFVANQLQAAGNVLRPGATVSGTADGSIVNILKQMKFGVKTLDVVSNEVQDVAEKLGLDPQDDPNAVFVPALIYGVNWAIGDETRNSNENEPALDASKILNSNQLEKAKQAYDTAEGTTETEKLASMAEQGWSDLQLWAFQKLLGL